MDDVTKRLVKYLTAEGFRIVRKSKHVLWSDGLVTVSTSHACSNPRTFKNLQRDVKRLRREAKERNEQRA